MYSLPKLPYSYSALEPYIDERTMTIHHDKHHATYVKNLNDVLAGNDDLLALPIETLLSNLDRVPETIRTKVKNNGGGHANHTIYWEIMQPGGAKEPTGKLLNAIKKSCGDFPTFIEHFSTKALNHFGSGWAWLVKEKDGSVTITDTANQDSPLNEGKTPILALDVWEHAYYLKYLNVRVEYIKAWWNVVNWDEVAKRYAAA
jgi:superoxide dismutase, Fe-Mn family